MPIKLFPFSQKELKEEISYNKLSGDFYWLKRKRGRNLNKSAGSESGDGYIYIMISGKKYKAHRLAYFYETNKQPNLIDHKNRIKIDNAFKNLNPTDSSGNSRNSSISYLNTSGYKGVSFHKASNFWISRTCVNGKVIQKYFDNKIDAILHRMKINKKYGFAGPKA